MDRFVNGLTNRMASQTTVLKFGQMWGLMCTDVIEEIVVLLNRQMYIIGSKTVDMKKITDFVVVACLKVYRL